MLPTYSPLPPASPSQRVLDVHRHFSVESLQTVCLPFLARERPELQVHQLRTNQKTPKALPLLLLSLHFLLPRGSHAPCPSLRENACNADKSHGDGGHEGALLADRGVRRDHLRRREVDAMEQNVRQVQQPTLDVPVALDWAAKPLATIPYSNCFTEGPLLQMLAAVSFASFILGLMRVGSRSLRLRLKVVRVR